MKMLLAGLLITFAASATSLAQTVNERIAEAYNRGFDDGCRSAGGCEGGGGETGGFGLAGLGSGAATIVTMPGWDSGGGSAGRVTVDSYVGNILTNDGMQGMSAFYYDGAKVRYGSSLIDLQTSIINKGVLDSDATAAWDIITLPDGDPVSEQIKRMQAMGLTSGILLNGALPAE